MDACQQSSLDTNCRRDYLLGLLSQAKIDIKSGMQQTKQSNELDFMESSSPMQVGLFIDVSNKVVLFSFTR